MGMKPPIFVRKLSTQERRALENGLRSSDAFVLRRCQILLASARDEIAPQIAENLGCGQQTVRNAIHEFDERGQNPSRAAPRAPRKSTPPSTKRGPRCYGNSCTVLRGSLAKRAAPGCWKTPHRSASSKGLRASGSRARPSEPP